MEMITAENAQSSSATAVTINSSQTQVSQCVDHLMQQCGASEAAAALIPWFCDALTSPKSRRDYFGDLSCFLSVMRQQGVHPYNVTGDHVRLYKEAMKEHGNKAATVARALSVIRGTYEQFGKKGLVDWQTIGDIQAVKTPKVDKGTTASLSEKEAIALLHAPDKTTLIGLRDHAMLFVYFKTACRFAAIANAKVGDLERTDTDWYLVVDEKGGKQRRLALLEPFC
jgi:integrase/recombinase XerD